MTGGTEKRASLAFALGLASLLVGPLGPFAVVTGWRSLRAIAASGGSLRGEGRALAGLVGGALSTAFLIATLAHFVRAALL